MGYQSALLSLREMAKCCLSVRGDAGMERVEEWPERWNSSPAMNAPNDQFIWGQKSTKWVIFEIRCTRTEVKQPAWTEQMEIERTSCRNLQKAGGR